MREIKFRAWNGVSMQPDVELVDIRPTKEFYNWSVNQLFVEDKRGIKWMQYTGLKDKNRVEIYEGDILRRSWGWTKHDGSEDYANCEVVIENSTIGFYWLDEPREYSDTNEDAGFHGCWDSGSNEMKWKFIDFEVIGNIHENEDLLKGIK